MNTQEQAIALKTYSKPNEIITWRIAAAIYWALAWRIGLTVGLLAGIRGGIIGYLYPQKFQWDFVVWVLIQILQIPVSIWIFKRTLEKGIANYRIFIKRN